MALFFDPDETMPELTDEDFDAVREQLTKPMDRLLDEIEINDTITRVDAHIIYKDVVDFMNIFFSESEKDRRIVKIALSDTLVDMIYKSDNVDAFPFARNALILIGYLLTYQCSAGGGHLIDCLDRTVKAFDKLFELWQRIYIRYPDRAKITNELMVNLVTFSAYPYMQVGDRKRFAEITRLEYKLASKMDLQFYKDVESDSGVMDKTDEEIWQEFRRHGRYRLACINCGEFEKKGKKHNRCGSCSNALYCSKECQVLHWKQHKADCRANSAPGRKKSAKQRS